MRILSLLILSSLFFFLPRPQDSPHGRSFKVSCKTCHSAKGWQLDKEIYSFNHNTTKLPLAGQHLQVNCRQCHPTLKFSEAKSNCIDCHNDIHQATVGPDCARCHTPASWLVNNITALHQVSRFPLLGAHRTADCIQCHKSENNARYDVSGINCIDCHRQNYLATTNPNHVLAGISEDCTKCHQINAFQWTGAGFDHSTFPLVQAHSTVKCVDCHKTASYAETKPDCSSCHQQDFVAAKAPDHVASQFAQTCQDCHTLAPGWKPVTINHNNFPLNLGHSTPACIDCHKGGNYTSTSAVCYTCHSQTYTSSTNPNHILAGFPTTCGLCHTLNPGWKPASIDHSRFPLKLGHSTPACADCHKSGNYSSTSIDCYTCHQQDYTATTNPNHIASGFVKTCSNCHTLTPGWKPAAYNHITFPLTLGHAGQACTDCHIGGNYTTTSPDCYSCHQQNYTATTNPNHTAAGFPTTCGTCHNTNPGWKPASFNHTAFPLTLGHATPTCADCHKGNYTSTSPDCFSCHVTDYNNSTNPNHKTLAFSTVCTQCHTTNPGWKPATYTQHDTQFPIYSGRHRGQWTVCTDCHTNTANYAIFTCITCHNKANMDSAHRGRTGYSFDSAACFRCHPRGTT
jgi:nitrate/TMAO reductase-like tetraheme cytochrome c subunit